MFLKEWEGEETSASLRWEKRNKRDNLIEHQSKREFVLVVFVVHITVKVRERKVRLWSEQLDGWKDKGNAEK